MWLPLEVASCNINKLEYKSFYTALYCTYIVVVI